MCCVNVAKAKSSHVHISLDEYESAVSDRAKTEKNEYVFKCIQSSVDIDCGIPDAGGRLCCLGILIFSPFHIDVSVSCIWNCTQYSDCHVHKSIDGPSSMSSCGLSRVTGARMFL